MDFSNRKKTSVMQTQYRDNTFEILKARHDNFSFKKAIDTKNKMFKTMNFEGILEHPLQPNLIIYGKTRKYNEFLQGKEIGRFVYLIYHA
jgi:hypothetical protein